MLNIGDCMYMHGIASLSGCWIVIANYIISQFLTLDKKFMNILFEVKEKPWNS